VQHAGAAAVRVLTEVFRDVLHVLVNGARGSTQFGSDLGIWVCPARLIAALPVSRFVRPTLRDAHFGGLLRLDCFVSVASFFLAAC